MRGHFLKFLLIGLLVLVALPVQAASIRFARAKSVLSLPILIAEEKGYFAAEGLDIQFIETRAGKQSVKKMFDGEADLAVSGTPPVVRSFLDNKDFCAVATVTEADNAQKILVDSKTGISRPEDLRGRRVGVPLGTGADYGFREFLFLNGMEYADLELVDVRPGPLSKGLKANNLDALIIWEPLASRVMSASEGTAQVLDTGGAMLLDYVLVATPTMSKQRYVELLKLLKAIERGNRFIADQRPEAIALQSEILGLTPAQSAEFLDEHSYRLSLGPRLVHAVERVADMMLTDEKSDAAMPDVSQMFCGQALQELIPENYQLLKE